MTPHEMLTSKLRKRLEFTIHWSITCVQAVNSLIEGAKLKAISYLKQNLHTITDNYLLAMTTYALTLARDPSAETAFTRLQEHAIVKGG